MRSFAIVAGLAASANAYAYGYPAYNETSSAAPAYPAASTPAGYPEASSAAGYSAYPVSSKAAEYPAYTTTTTVKGLTTVCSEATSFSVGTKTYVVTKPTTIIDEDCEYTTAVVVKPTPSAAKPIVSVPAPGKPSMVAPGMPSMVAPPVVPYPSKNGTAPTYPVATGTPSSTKPSTPQFTGAAAQAGVGMLAIVGAVAAFL
jgi:hypothetical protein